MHSEHLLAALGTPHDCMERGRSVWVGCGVYVLVGGCVFTASKGCGARIVHCACACARVRVRVRVCVCVVRRTDFTSQVPASLLHVGDRPTSLHARETDTSAVIVV